ncbi:MAG: response regulator [Clostridia bacterium]|nr:response regulator [Clostridia bacterium]
MLKLVIAEDEELDRNGLKNINWHDMGIELAGIYENGRDAFDAIENSIPDIILTDIKMPKMDGLTLARKVNYLSQNVKIVFISGYGDFNYAKEAIELSASKYILKPFEIQELIDVMSEISNQCNEEKKRLLEDQIIQQKLNESLPLLKEKFCMELLDGIYKNEENIRKRIEFLGVPINLEGRYYVNLIEIDNYNDLTHGKEDSYVNVLPLYIIDVIKGALNGKQNICINKGESVFAVILSYDEQPAIEQENYNAMEKIQLYLNKYFKVDVTVGISRVCNTLKNIRIADIQAEEALKYKYSVGINQIISVDDILDRDTIELDQIIKDTKNKLMSELIAGNTEGVKDQINIIFHALVDFKSNKFYVQSICIDIINNVSRLLLNTGSETLNTFDKSLGVINKLLEFDKISDIRAQLNSILLEVAAYNQQKSNSRIESLVEQIKGVIDERFAEDLTVSTVAQEVYLSAGYATSLFKKGTNMSIMDYIIKVRIDTAKKMLQDPNSRISEVSYQVGYENIAYFSSLFKKVVGMNPKEYRNCQADL